MTAGTALNPAYAVGTWKLDGAHSELSFSVKHLAISKVRGFFRSFVVTIVTAPDWEDSTVAATIDIESIDTNNEMRDGHLRSNDFFLAAEYPQATFRSTSISGTPDAFDVDGELTLRGVTKPVTLRGEFGGINTAADGTVHAGATVTTKLNRTDFGIVWNAPVESGGRLLGEEVTLSMELQVVLQA